MKRKPLVLVSGAIKALPAGDTLSDSIGEFALWMSAEIKIWPAATPPTGWLLCNGAAVSRAIYAAIFAVLGTTWGTGDGSTTFNLPNFADKSPVGVSGSKVLGSSGGVASITPAGSVSIAGTALAINQMPSHAHALVDQGHSHGVTDPGHLHGIVQPINHPGGSTVTGEALQTGLQVGGTMRYFTQTNAAATGISVNSAASNIQSIATGGGGTHSHLATFAGNAVSTQSPYAATNFIIKI